MFVAYYPIKDEISPLENKRSFDLDLCDLDKTPFLGIWAPLGWGWHYWKYKYCVYVKNT